MSSESATTTERQGDEVVGGRFVRKSTTGNWDSLSFIKRSIANVFTIVFFCLRLLFDKIF